jgi:hypothetical protein
MTASCAVIGGLLLCGAGALRPAPLPNREAVMHPSSPLDTPWQENDRIGPWRKVTFSEFYRGEKRSAEEFVRLVTEAARANAATVRVPPGIYHTSSRASGVHCAFREIRGLSIDAHGVVLLCHSPTRALELESCEDLVLSGLVIDYAPDGLPFTQGTVTAASPENQRLTVRIHDGYPVPGPELKTIRKVEAHDPHTLLLKRDVGTTYDAPFSVLDDRTVGIQRVRGGYAVGDYAALICGQGWPHGVTVRRCTRVTLEDVVIHAAPVFAIADALSASSTYRRVSITPGPIPDGGTIPRVKSGAQDGINFHSLRQGARIQDCLIEYHSDDGIAVSTAYYPVFAVQGDTVVIGSKGGEEVYGLAAGDVLRCTRRADMTIYGTATIKSIAEVKDSATIAAMNALYPTLQWGRIAEEHMARGRYWTLRLADAPTIAPGDIRAHRARSMLLKTSEVLVENNLIEHGQSCGIILAPEWQWLEADFTWNATIRRNTIRGNGHGPSNPNSVQPAVISVVGLGMKGFAPAGQHRNIVIEGNTLERCYVMPFAVSAAEHVRIQDNTIDGTHFVEKKTGATSGFDQTSLLFLRNVKDVTIRGNVVRGAGKYLQHGVSGDVEAVVGRDDGFVVR